LRDKTSPQAFDFLTTPFRSTLEFYFVSLTFCLCVLVHRSGIGLRRNRIWFFFLYLRPKEESLNSSMDNFWKLENKYDGLKEKFRELDYLYHQRDLNEATLDKALFLIRRFRSNYEERPFSFSSLSAEAMRALSVTCEALDYFNRLDIFMGCDYGLAEREIYDWLIRGSSDLQSLIPVNADKLTGDEDPSLLLCQIRLVAAIYLNEKYRNNKLDFVRGADSELGKLISFAERCLRPRMEGDFQTLTAYNDVMANLTFLHGKAARQAGQYFEAERSFYQSSSCLLNLALTYSTQPEAENETIDFIRSKVRRIGIVDLARAWLYMAWGKIDKSNLYVERAIQLLGPKDTLSKALAESIQGIVLRIGSGHDSEKLKEAISRLKSSYESFFSDSKVLRHSIRTLYELEIALILNNDLKDAFDNLDRVVGKINTERVLDYSREGIHRRDFRKLVENSRWQSQMYVLCSRIARKDEHNKLRDSLFRLSNDLLKVRKIKSQTLLDEIPKVSSLELAIKFAKTARDIAVDNNLTTCRMDSLIVLGEAYIHSGKYDEASKTFKQCLGFVNAPHGQSPVKGIDGSDLSAVSYLYLALIAVRTNDQPSAEKALEDYQKLPPVEHSWIRNLALRVNEELKVSLETRIIVPFSRSMQWQDLTNRLKREAIRKMIIEPLNNKEKPKKLWEMLGIGKTRFYQLRDWYNEDGKPRPQIEDNEQAKTVE
jgi:hypothetical protein